MKNLLLTLLFISTSTFAQLENVTVFGPKEHGRADFAQEYQTTKVDGVEYKNAILYLDVNNTLEEIIQANKAAKEIGKTLIIVPKMSWSEREQLKKDERRYNKEIYERVSQLETEIQNTDDTALIEAKENEIKALNKEEQELREKLFAFYDSDTYPLSNKNLPKVFDEIKEAGYSIDTLIAAGHTAGTESNGDLNFSPSFFDSANSNISRKNLIEEISKRSNDPLFSNLNHIYASGCNSLTPYEAKQWMNGLNSLQTCTGFEGQAGLSGYGAMSESAYLNVAESESFYKTLVNLDKADVLRGMQGQIENMHGNYPNAFMNLAMSYRAPDGTLYYQGYRHDTRDDETWGRVSTSDQLNNIETTTYDLSNETNGDDSDNDDQPQGGDDSGNAITTEIIDPDSGSGSDTDTDNDEYWVDENGNIVTFVLPEVVITATRPKPKKCKKMQAKDIIDEFTGEFLEIKSQLSMYKLAWTTLVLSGTQNNDEIKSLETVISSTAKDFFDKVETDPEFKKQYEDLLSYESPYKTKWMTKTKNYLPNAIEFLSRKMHSTDFISKVLKEKYKGEAGKNALAQIQEDIDSYGVDLSDKKTTELMHDLYKDDKFANSYLSNYSTQITSSLRGRGGLKTPDEKFYKKQIDQMNQKMADLNEKVYQKVKAVCGTLTKFVSHFDSNPSCVLKDPEVDISAVMSLTPILNEINLKAFDIDTSKKGYKLTNKKTGKENLVKKEYLKVSRTKGQCEFNDAKNGLPKFNFKNIPQTGEYHIAYIGNSGKSKDQIKKDLKQLKKIHGYKNRNSWFKNYLTESKLMTKRIEGNEVSLSSNSSSTNYSKDYSGNKAIATFDNGKINIPKDKADQFIVISSWGNNKNPVTCKSKTTTGSNVAVNTSNGSQGGNNTSTGSNGGTNSSSGSNGGANTSSGSNGGSGNTPVFNEPVYSHSINALDGTKDKVRFNQWLAQQELINGHDYSTKIKMHHKIHPEEGQYIVVDKKNSRIEVRDKSGKLLDLIDVTIAAQERGDKVNLKHPSSLNSTNKQVGAGIFSVDRFGKTEVGGENNIIFMKDQKGRELKTAIRGSESDPQCTSCIIVPQDKLKLVQEHLATDSKIYVLPEEDLNMFMYKNNQINFTRAVEKETKVDQMLGLLAKPVDYSSYNFSPKDDKNFKTHFKLKGKYKYGNLYVGDLVEHELTLRTAQIPNQYMNTIFSEKENLMEMYGLDNDEFNQLAKLAFGILGQESEFGKGRKYRTKESSNRTIAGIKQSKVTELKLYKNIWKSITTLSLDPVRNADSYVNSRGLTQIKYMPDKIKKEYKIDLEDLNDPKAAGLATMGVLAEKLGYLNNLQKYHEEITPYNKLDYLLYFYYGAAHEITNNTATPEMNIYTKNVRKYADDHLEIWQLTKPE